MEEVHSYGVNRQDICESVSMFHAEEISRLGVSIIPGALKEVSLIQYRNRLDACYQKQDEALGFGRLAECNDEGIVRCPLVEDSSFLDLATDERLLDILRLVLGENFVLLMQNGIIMKSTEKAFQAQWHRDLNYQHWISSKPLSINMLYCLDDFTVDRGCTFALPGSHLHENFPSDEFVRKHEVPILAKAGDVIMMNAMTFHRGGINITDLPRRAVNHVVGLPFLGQQIDIPKMLGDTYALDPFLANYLGYKWNPASSVEAWRNARMPVSK
ncbi:phytanoyl-CoA dioxygenase family protein [Oceanicoccus sp. KOV_DT_Chl]|uniref:phytanoyl-CoA dioxygenase family protein n=1 Tax=Oceanicoccus sp. KOV_DT_Chl TaxID=1904639 RepID=UPI000C7CE92A|nr:phytanoyl-CoA dioxygenase family protein [Oceanicoccus sp. KOV_DT_Chl]